MADGLILIFQIAAGIVLAILILANLRAILGFAAILIVGALLLVGGAAVYQWASPNLLRIIITIGQWILGMLGLLAAYVSGYALFAVFHHIRNRDLPEFEGSAQWIFCVGNAVLLATVFEALYFTPAGRLWELIDNWSRERGYQDFGSVALFTICLMWPIPLAFWLRTKAAVVQSTDVDLQGEDL